jgi:hypothetical protein
MAKRRKFYKTVLTVVVLSEDRAPSEHHDLDVIAYNIKDGDWSGEVACGKPQRLTGAEMADELQKQGSDPGFFQLDKNGRSTPDD